MDLVPYAGRKGLLGVLFKVLSIIPDLKTLSSPMEVRPLWITFYSITSTAAAKTVVQRPFLLPWADWQILVVLIILPLAW